MSNPVTDRTRLRRKASRGSHERAVIDAILDEALVCHVGFVGALGPVVIPTAFVRLDDHIYLHGAVANHMLRSLAAGPEVSVAVTLLDGIVLARTALHHSVNYRSVVMFGRAAAVTDPAAKLRVLAALLDHVVAGRSAACRLPDPAELAATQVIALPIEEASAKIRSGPPLPDAGDDLALPHWAGVIPLVTSRGTPLTAPDCAVPPPG